VAQHRRIAALRLSASLRASLRPVPILHSLHTAAPLRKPLRERRVED